MPGPGRRLTDADSDKALLRRWVSPATRSSLERPEPGGASGVSGLCPAVGEATPLWNWNMGTVVQGTKPPASRPPGDRTRPPGASGTRFS